MHALLDLSFARRSVQSRTLLILCCAGALLFGTGCSSGKTASDTSTTSLDASRAHDSYSGKLRNYAYEFHIWWDGPRCERREIRMQRECGLCRGEVTRARFYDHDCDGVAEQFITRAEHQNLSGDRRTLEEEAWHAFFLFVPPTQTGDNRKVPPESG